MAKRNYKQEYENERKNTRAYGFKLSYSVDGDLIEKLDTCGNIAAYLKALIRADMEKQKEKGE